METGLKDKLAIITGAAVGVGRAISRALAGEGARVVVADINGAGAEQVTEQLRKTGKQAMAMKVDVTVSSQIDAMVKEVIKKFNRIDILVNNAGIVGQQGPWAGLKEENFERIVAVNFKGVYLCSKAVIPHMITQRGGKIINVSSCAAKTGEEFNGVYSATKAAVLNMTQSLSREIGQYNINVNAICPAAMDTDLMEKVYRERSQYFKINPEDLRKKIKSSFRLPRELTVQDAANVVVFLASDKADMMTGQGINITGGIEVH